MCPDDALDVMTGAAGLLLGAAVLVEELGTRPSLVALGERLEARLARAAAAPAGAPGWLGAAHGSAGLAHALLRWPQATGTAPRPELPDLLQSLAGARARSGLWPRRAGDAETWPGWCHGSAGWVLLWALAATVLGDERLLELAEAPALHAVGAGGDGGPSLCCGLAGRAYAAVAMGRATGDARWFTRAQELGGEAAAAAPGDGYPQHSLWRGDVGAALLVAELEDPTTAALPLYAPSRPGRGAAH
jgi:hypothetical protein